MRVCQQSLFFFFFIAIFSCNKVEYTYPDNPDYVRKSRAGKAFDKGDLFLYKKKPIKDFPFDKKNKCLWNASLAVTQELSPIAIMDESSQIIVSEWYNDDKNNRIKISALIKDASVLQISAFRESLDNKGRKLSQLDQKLSRSIEEKILEKCEKK
jgi:hypothetical protein